MSSPIAAKSESPTKALRVSTKEEHSTPTPAPSDVNTNNNGGHVTPTSSSPTAPSPVSSTASSPSKGEGGRGDRRQHPRRSRNRARHAGDSSQQYMHGRHMHHQQVPHVMGAPYMPGNPMQLNPAMMAGAYPVGNDFMQVCPSLPSLSTAPIMPPIMPPPPSFPHENLI